MASVSQAVAATSLTDGASRPILSWLLAGLLALGAVLVLGGVPASLRFQAQAVGRPLWLWESAACVLLGMALLCLLRQGGGPVLRGGATLFGWLSGGLLAPILVGLVLRVLAAVMLAPTPASDGATYLMLAKQLAEGQPYLTGTLHAYWPPGLPLALAPLVAVFGAGALSLTLYGLLCFSVAAAGTWRLGIALGLSRWATVPVWLLALWPSHLLCSGLPEKELLVIALMPWVAALLHEAWHARRVLALGAGVLLGAMVLVQPSLQLLLPAGMLLGLWLLSQRLRVLSLTLLVALGMAAAVLPWTLRNWQVLGSPVLVSTNGGSNAYRANNEMATGAYIDEGKVSLAGLSELEADREGKRLALAWLVENPRDFLSLSLAKSLLYSGDDSYGAFAALKRGRDDVPPTIYKVVKLAAMLPWIALWILIGLCALRLGRRLPLLLVLPAVPYVYLLVLHSVFESGGKYHLPALAPTLVLAVLLVRSLQERMGGSSREG